MVIHEHVGVQLDLVLFQSFLDVPLHHVPILRTTEDRLAVVASLDKVHAQSSGFRAMRVVHVANDNEPLGVGNAESPSN